MDITSFLEKLYVFSLAAFLGYQVISKVPQLLHTYSAERQVVAQELIDFDREWARMFSDRAKQAASTVSGSA